MLEVEVYMQLKSEAIFGSGVEDGLVHEDARYDKDHLIFLPAKEWKGLLKKTAQNLGKKDEKFQEVYNYIFVEDRKKDVLENIVEFSNLELSSRIKKVLKDQAKGERLSLQTVVRQFISIEFKSNTTKEGSLRNVRCIREGLVFTGTILLPLTEDKKDKVKYFFDKVQCFFTNIGGGANRGRGEVEWKFNIHEQKPDRPVETTQNKSDSLQLILELMEPIIIGRYNDRSNQKTDKFINASTLNGCFISQLLRQAKNEDEIEKYEKQFIYQKAVCFQDAYLYEDGEKAYPTPTHYSIDKHEYRNNDENSIKLFNGFLSETPQNPAPIKPSYIMSTEDNGIRERNVQINEQLHLKIEHNKEKDNILYRYEMLEKGQQFYTTIEVKDFSAIVHIEMIFAKGKVLKIGKSRSTGYGGVQVIGLEKNSKSNLAKGLHDQFLDLYCYTKAIFVDDYGNVTDNPSIELNRLFEEDYKFELQTAFVKTDVFGGYVHKWQSELPKQVGVVAGSVYRFNSPDGLDLKKIYEKIENHAFGARTEEGFGRVLVNPTFLYREKLLKIEANREKGRDINSEQTELIDTSETINFLKKRINDQALLLKFYQLESELVGKIKFKNISNQVLRRFIEWMKGDELSDAQKKAEEFNNTKLIDVNGKSVIEFMNRPIEILSLSEKLGNKDTFYMVEKRIYNYIRAKEGREHHEVD